MTEVEALKLLNNYVIDTSLGLKALAETSDFMNTCEKALKKQIPMEHHHTRIDHIVDDVRISICPSCLAVIPSHRTEYPNYCIRCGQRIDWGE